MQAPCYPQSSQSKKEVAGPEPLKGPISPHTAKVGHFGASCGRVQEALEAIGSNAGP